MEARYNMKILGIDTGLANLGWAIVGVTDDGMELIKAGTVRTIKSTRRVTVADDRMRRMQEQARYLLATIDMSDIALLCFEGQSWPRNSTSCAMIGMSWGLCVMLSELHKIPIIQATPTDIKVALTGGKTASKAVMIAALREREGFESIVELLDTLPKTRQEHPVDAAGAVIASRHDDTLRALLRLSATKAVADAPEGAKTHPARPRKAKKAPPPPPTTRKK
tara:strand:- start:796 stop:1461 length:666 start_codon:yes stop_codon:yes gene_type:complete